MNRKRRIVSGSVVALAAVAALATLASPVQAVRPARPEVSGTLWVANRGAHTARAFDAATGAFLREVPLRPGSQPGDLAVARGKVYVAEEFATPPGIAVIDARSGAVRDDRILTSARPHHVHTSPGGTLLAFGLYGTNKIALVDTRTDTLVEEWEASTNALARAHAGAFSPDGRTVYVALDNVGELAAVDVGTGLVWSMSAPGAHEVAISHDGKTAYVSARNRNALYVVDLEEQVIERTIAIPAPDTLQLSPNEKLLTVGLRIAPAQMAVVDTETFDDDTPQIDFVTIGGPGTLAGHQWTSPNGDYTFAAFEGPGAGVAVIDHTEGHAVEQTLAYPGRPHGVDFTRP